MAQARARDEGRSGEAPCPGDLFVFRETADFDVQWAVLRRDSCETVRLLVVPADLDPRVGSGDVAVAARGSHGALTLRCRFSVWLSENAFDLERRTGLIGPEDLGRALSKHDEIGRGRLHGSPPELETDEEPEYQAWERGILARAQAALAESFSASIG